MNTSRLDKQAVALEGETMSSPLDEMLKRLEVLERRVQRLEAAAAHVHAPAASNADDFAVVRAPRPATSAASGVLVGAQGDSSPARDPAAGARGATSARPGYSAGAPVTERLDRVPADGSTGDAFPDLSQLDEKLERRKGPAERLQVRAALEDYPRIATRIQQLWGTPDCEAYLNSLVIDTRGNRQGFSPVIMEELLYLGRLARALVILNVKGDLWDVFDQVGDRR